MLVYTYTVVLRVGYYDLPLYGCIVNVNSTSVEVLSVEEAVPTYLYMYNMYLCNLL